MGSEQSSSVSDSTDNIDLDETCFLPGEVAKLEAKWKKIFEVPRFLSRLKSREIKDPPSGMYGFIPLRTSTVLKFEPEPSPLFERFMKELEENPPPPRGAKRKRGSNKIEMPRPKTPEGYWNPGWISPTKDKSETAGTNKGSPRVSTPLVTGKSVLRTRHSLA